MRGRRVRARRRRGRERPRLRGERHAGVAGRPSTTSSTSSPTTRASRAGLAHRPGRSTRRSRRRSSPPTSCCRSCATPPSGAGVEGHRRRPGPGDADHRHASSTSTRRATETCQTRAAGRTSWRSGSTRTDEGQRLRQPGGHEAPTCTSTRGTAFWNPRVRASARADRLLGDRLGLPRATGPGRRGLGLGPAGADHLLPVARARARVGVAPIRAHAAASRGRRARRRRRDVHVVRRRLRRRPRPRVRVRARSSARLVAAAHEHGEVVYAVPGSPGGRRAHGRAAARRCQPSRSSSVAGVSFADLAWVRARRRPDGRRRACRRRARHSTTRRARAADCSSRSATTSSCSPT